MKEKIINILVIVVMVVIANYPLYTNLKKIADEVNSAVQSVRTEIAFWQKDAKELQSKVESVRNDIVSTIDQGIGQTDEVLAKISEIESDIQKLTDQIDSAKANAIKDVENKIENIKEEPVDVIKDLFKIKG